MASQTPARTGRLLLDRTDAETVEEDICRAVMEAIERRALVLSRVGHGRFVAMAHGRSVLWIAMKH